MPQNIVRLSGVTKTYPLYDSASDRLKELVGLRRFAQRREFTALSNVSCEAARGEMLCVVGENGAGKSTLLQIIAGIMTPTSGEVEVGGRVAALLELGSGFNPDFSGRENVYLNAALHGFSRRDIDRRFDEIADFAEVGEFMDRPVRTWSSGMIVRLAFAVAIHVEPEILILDEALAVGDMGFRQRCMRKVSELRRNGVTILLVSHSMADAEGLADRALWLDHGHVRAVGDPRDVVSSYLAQIDRNYARSRQSDDEQDALENIDHRFGDGRAEILGMALLDGGGRRLPMLIPGQRMTVRVTAVARRRIARPSLGFLMRNHLGLEFAGTDTLTESREMAPLEAGDLATAEFRMQTPELYPSSFSFSPFVCDATSVCDQVDNAITVEVSRGEREIYGQVHLPCRIELDRALEAWTVA